MRILQTQSLTVSQKNTILTLWNEEYPANIMLQSTDQLNEYLNGLSDMNHFFMVDDKNNVIAWAFTFTRQAAKWFAIIVDKSFQGKGKGKLMLHHLKEKENELNGWVVETNDYIKNDGSLYVSPIAFYSKNGFKVFPDIRFENDKMKAVKIQWRKIIANHME